MLHCPLIGKPLHTLLPVLVQGFAPGVVYVGHLPQTLAEPQLTSYFSQFGTILRLRLSRSKKVNYMSLSDGNAV